MTAEPGSTDRTTGWLAHVQVSLFAVTMGLGGLGLAWRAADRVLGWPGVIGEAILILAALCFVAVATLYAAKFMRHRAAVAAEFADPLRMNFFAAASIGLLLLADAAIPYAPAIAEGLWILAAALHLTLAISVVRCWVTRDYAIHHASPAWFIPVVGNIVVPLAGVQLGHVEISWFFFSVGLVFWIVLFAILLYRIVFHDPIPTRALPTLFILLAPPALGFSAYDRLSDGGLDGAGRVLFYVALFLVLFLLSMAPRFLKVPFALSWWAYTFPSAAMAAACLRFHELAATPATAALAGVALVASSAIIALVAAATLGALLSGRLFQPDG